MRLVSIGLLAACAALVFVLFGGGVIPPCIGPIGGTPAGCVKSTGVFPNPGLGLAHWIAVGLGSVALATRTSHRAARAAALSLVALSFVGGALGYGLLRPRALVGPAFDATVAGRPAPTLVLEWPFHWPSAIGIGLTAAAIALFVGAVVIEIAAGSQEAQDLDP